MLALRKCFSFLLLAAYSLVLLHSIIPHFHVDGNGHAFMSDLHNDHHDHSVGFHKEEDTKSHEDFFVDGFAHIFDGLFHVAADENHLVHTSPIGNDQKLCDADFLFLPHADFSIAFNISNGAEVSNHSPPCLITSNFLSSDRPLRAPPVHV